jgi:uncharacterized protein
MHINIRIPTLIAALLVAVLLASCAKPPVPPEPRPRVDLVAEADAALAAGDDARAAELLEQAAQATESPEREHLLLRAISLHLYLDEMSRAEALLRGLPSVLPVPLQYHRELLEVRRLLQLDRPAAAYLAFTTLGEPPAHLQLETLRVQADTALAVGLPLVSAQARVELEQRLTDPELLADNREQLWLALSQTPMEVLRERMPPPPDAFGGWLELAFVVRSYRLDADKLERALAQWRGRYPGHAARDEFLPQLLTRFEQQLQRPQRLALLLPLSGPLGASGQAIRDGFLAAYYSAGPNRPELRVYDLGGSSNVIAAYDEAIMDGADFIIGPLTKNSVAMLAARGSLPVPTLALNTLPDDAIAPLGLYQFGLSPEDEAQAAAAYAIEQGYENALVLVPEGEWGQRVAQAFTAAFSGGYQRVLETAYYKPNASDFSEPIRELLNLDASDRRLRQLRSALQRNVNFERRRRQDVDVIFVGAFPRDGRLIQPQLRFHHAMDIPVLATSHVFTGKVDAAADRDMDGIRFVDIPWLLAPQRDDALSRTELVKHWSGVDRQPRLYALGIDAYKIVPYLEALRAYSGDSLDGATGVLQVDPLGRVHRKLLPARFAQGRPRLVPPTLDLRARAEQ